jgi:peroxiredoxin
MKPWLLLIPLWLLTLAAFGAPPQQTLTAVEKLPPAPDFELRDMDDNSYRLSAQRGKVVIINFWATWCPPCLKEMPSMQRAWEQLRDEGVEMWAINVGESDEEIFLFTARYPVDFPLLLDSDSSITDQWPVIGLPSTFIVDREGRIAYRAIGGREWDAPELLEQIHTLLQ